MENVIGEVGGGFKVCNNFVCVIFMISILKNLKKTLKFKENSQKRPADVCSMYGQQAKFLIYFFCGAFNPFCLFVSNAGCFNARAKAQSKSTISGRSYLSLLVQ